MIPQLELFSFCGRNHKLLSRFTDLYPIVYFFLESTLGCSRLLTWGLPNKAGSWQTHLSELNDEISIGAFAMDFSLNFQSWNSLQLSKRSPVKKLFCWFINNKIFLWAILPILSPHCHCSIVKNNNIRTVQAESSKFASLSFDQGFQRVPWLISMKD